MKEVVDTQYHNAKESVTHDGNPFTGDGKAFTYDGNPFIGDRVQSGKQEIHIESISINAIFVDGKGRYGNGEFVAVFSEAAKAIAACSDFHEGALRVCLYLLGHVSKHQVFEKVTLKDIEKKLSMSESTARRAVQSLMSANVICRCSDGGTSLYALSDKLFNPRVAVHGNTKKLNKKDMPLLLSPSGVPLLGSKGFAPSLEFMGDEQIIVDPLTGDITHI